VRQFNLIVAAFEQRAAPNVQSAQAAQAPMQSLLTYPVQDVCQLQPDPDVGNLRAALAETQKELQQHVVDMNSFTELTKRLKSIQECLASVSQNSQSAPVDQHSSGLDPHKAQLFVGMNEAVQQELVGECVRLMAHLRDAEQRTEDERQAWRDARAKLEDEMQTLRLDRELRQAYDQSEPSPETVIMDDHETSASLAESCDWPLSEAHPTFKSFASFGEIDRSVVDYAASEASDVQSHLSGILRNRAFAYPASPMPVYPAPPMSNGQVPMHAVVNLAGLVIEEEEIVLPTKQAVAPSADFAPIEVRSAWSRLHEDQSDPLREDLRFRPIAVAEEVFDDSAYVLPELEGSAASWVWRQQDQGASEIKRPALDASPVELRNTTRAIQVHVQSEPVSWQRPTADPGPAAAPQEAAAVNPWEKAVMAPEDLPAAAPQHMIDEELARLKAWYACLG